MRRQLLISLAAATAAAAISGIVTASADTGFTCANKSGGVTGAPGTVSALRVAHHDGYDRLVFEFASTAAGAIPEYSLSQQNSSSFTRDASGQTVRLDGSDGIRTVFRNTSVGSGVPSDVKSALPAIREVANIGDFERVTSYGIGLSSAACFRVLELSGPTRLVLDVQTAPDAAPSAAPVSTTAAPNPAPATSDITPPDLASTGHPSAPSQPAGLPLAQIALGLLVLTGGIALAGLRLVTRK